MLLFCYMYIYMFLTEYEPIVTFKPFFHAIFRYIQTSTTQYNIIQNQQKQLQHPWFFFLFVFFTLELSSPKGSEGVSILFYIPSALFSVIPCIFSPVSACLFTGNHSFSWLTQQTPAHLKCFHGFRAADLLVQVVWLDSADILRSDDAVRLLRFQWFTAFI